MYDAEADFIHVTKLILDSITTRGKKYYLLHAVYTFHGEPGQECAHFFTARRIHTALNASFCEEV